MPPKKSLTPKPVRNLFSHNLDAQSIYCGDNLKVLREMPSGFVDLIYIDPPFNSDRNYETFWGETKEKRIFEDRHASTRAYIDYMRPRCVELARVLKPTGSFYYHCDWHASHYVKVMLDQLFGENCFRCEIVWRRTTAKGLATRGYPNNHDSIFYYSNGGRYTWNQPFVPYDMGNLDRKTLAKYAMIDEHGRRYTLGDLTNPNPDRPNLRYEFLGFTKTWRWTKDRMTEAYKKGLVVQPNPGSVPRVKRYLNERQGRPVDSIWGDIPPVNSQSSERTGYPTQKPLTLLDRIIKASSNKDDLVLDAFCGCGTALVAAQQAERRWIGIDMSPTACRVMAARLEKVCGLKEKTDFVITGLPFEETTLRKLPPFEFQNWAVVALGGVSNTRKTGDMGIDGKIYPVDAIDDDLRRKPDQLDFMDHWYPVQVKQKNTVHRNDIDGFETVLRREKRTRGFFVAFDYSDGALREIDRFLREEKLAIVPLTVKQILDEEAEVLRAGT